MEPRSHCDFTKHILGTALLLRLGLIIFSIWQDASRWPDGQLRFTDVDYDVFTDAAKAMLAGADIYAARPTYRYSPLIALLLYPGQFITSTFSLSRHFYIVAYAFGKTIFIAADIFCALLQRSIILTENPDKVKDVHAISWLVGVFWLFNPVTATVSVRGNAESVLGVCVLACLWCLLRKHIALAGLLFGLCIHLKLYPVIYAPIIYLQLCDLSQPINLFQLLPVKRHWCFGFTTLSSLTVLTWASYTAYGWAFLHQAYFYHFTRVDFWHNFALHFYPIYLFEGLLALNTTTTHDPGIFPYNYFPAWFLEAFYRPENILRIYTLFKVVIMLPSTILVVTLPFCLYRTPSFAWFAITFIFVSFNKVCTSQYFLWWLVLLPPALAHIRLSPDHHEATEGLFSSEIRIAGISATAVHRAVFLVSLWFVGQACWLTVAYLHEMGSTIFWGRGLWLALWSASAFFFVVNVIILKCLMRWLLSGLPLSSSEHLEPAKSLKSSETSLKFGRFRDELEGVLRKRTLKIK